VPIRVSIRQTEKASATMPGFVSTDGASVLLGEFRSLKIAPDVLRDRLLSDSPAVRPQKGGFFVTALDGQTLIARPRELTDNAVPAGNSLAAELLLRLGDLTGRDDDRRRGAWMVETLGEPLTRYPTAFGYALGAAELAVHGATEVALVGDAGASDFEALVRETASHYLPSLILAGGIASTSEPLPLLRDRPALSGKATAYVCRHYVCDSPVSDARTLGEQLERAASGLD